MLRGLKCWRHPLYPILKCCVLVRNVTFLHMHIVFMITFFAPLPSLLLLLLLLCFCCFCFLLFLLFSLLLSFVVTFFSLVSSRAVFTEVFYWYKSIIFLCLFGVIPIGCTCLMSTRVDTVRPLEPRGRAWPRAVLRGASTGGGDAYAGLTLLLLRSAIMRTLTLVMNRDRLFLIVRSCCSHSQ